MQIKKAIFVNVHNLLMSGALANSKNEILT